MLISLILFVVVIILAAYIASNNLTDMVINVLGYPVHGTTGMLVISAFGIGLLLGVLLTLPAVISRSWAVIRHRRTIQDLQDQQARMHKQTQTEQVEEEE